jgi:dUTP pyrophosphatase
MNLPIELVILNPEIEEYGLPTWATTGSAGMDLRALNDAELYPGEQAEFPLGFAISLPFGTFALLAPRSSLGVQRIHLSNLVGIIDSDYQGEILVNLTNNSRHPEPFKIKKGNRIAQLVILPFAHAAWNVVPNFTYETDRGSGGFGSTGAR